eukprot:CAMPEP_0174231900 /NCGR_PEP_ID=MMETSP0417-20130205/2314_1 /TAXON_ID=242541 /ORGANISM="Mayorella sp, Strain BSH-02190019" /LENGTH=349 /DNA_ID=CAMNT_0015309863 /DNA_START=63 /DNA_END=1109 /DNA_ORIENTATION=+
MSVSERIPVWIDCDPGHDDAMALLLAGHHPRLEVLGISTVFGNQSVEKTTLNALKVLQVGGLEHIPVYMGQAKPLVRPGLLCPEIHGESGLDIGKKPTEVPASEAADDAVSSVGFPPLTLRVREGKAVLRMYEHIAASERKVTLVAVGCLTNVALLLTLYPEVRPLLERIVLMGGAMGVGNISPVAEFNILNDPEAASVVFEAGVPLVQVPLEVTHTGALVTRSVLDRIRALQRSGAPTEAGDALRTEPGLSPFLRLITDLLLFFGKTYKEVFGFDDPPLHDPVAVAYVIDPSMFTVEQMRVDVELQSAMCAGQTVCDIFHMSTKPKNVTMCKRVDSERFWELMYECYA